tara:strand:+ start:442 stop:567 length:126 start_codon:yes stop_codon:yes gene_type:complete
MILNGFEGPKNPAFGVSPSPLIDIDGGFSKSDKFGKIDERG